MRNTISEICFTVCAEDEIMWGPYCMYFSTETSPESMETVCEPFGSVAMPHDAAHDYKSSLDKGAFLHLRQPISGPSEFLYGFTNDSGHFCHDIGAESQGKYFPMSCTTGKHFCYRPGTLHCGDHVITKSSSSPETMIWGAKHGFRMRD